MRQHPEIPSEPLSRRSALRRMTLATGGTAALATGLIGRRAAADQKMAKAAVGYQETPQGEAECGNCEQFQSPAACKVVEGNISPGAWCKIYAKKSA